MTVANITFIGAGNMARSLVGGLVEDGYEAGKITVSAPSENKLDVLRERFGVNTQTDNVRAAENADVIFLAVKPRVVEHVLLELANLIKDKKPMIISIAAGIRIKKIQKLLGDDIAIVRCMPNIPALLRTGATALFANKNATEDQQGIAESIMRSVGLIVWLEEEAQLDTVTCLSGSGPAYFFLVIEAMQSAAQELGLSHDDAKLLTLQTALGAARMALESNEDATVLRQQVTSPGGTTEAAMSVFEGAEFKKLFLDAMRAAKTRAEELSQ